MLRVTVFTLFALAVCICASVAVLSIVDSVLLRRLPIPDPDRLVLMDQAGTVDVNDLFNVDVSPRLKDMKAFSGVGLFATGTVTVTGGSEPAQVRATMTSPGFFDVMKVPPAVGRTLLPDDHRKGGAYAAILSDGLWKRVFGEDRSVPGRTLLINGRPTLIVGVMPPGFDFPDASEIWMPATLSDSPFSGQVLFRYIGRLRDNASLAQARAEVEQAARQNNPELARTYSFDVITLRKTLVAHSRPPLVFFLGGGVLVWLLLVGLRATRPSTREQDPGETPEARA